MRQATIIGMLITMLLSMASCDDGTPMDQEELNPNDYVDYITFTVVDKQGNNLLGAEANKNPNVKLDPEIYIEKGGGRLLAVDFIMLYNVKWDYPEIDEEWWALGVNNINTMHPVLELAGIYTHPSKSYEFDIVSPNNGNYRWHIKLKYVTPTIGEQRGQIEKRYYVDGKLSPSKRGFYDVLLVMDK